MKKFFTPPEFARLVSEHYDSLIFDLDNTIYDENEFLFDRYRVIALRLARDDKDFAQEAFEFLRCKFLSEGRTRLFDVFLKHFDESGRYTVDDLLACLREPLGALRPFEYFVPLVRHCGRRIYLVTNGNPRQQRNKLAALGIEYRFDRVVLANEVSKKPSPLALEPLRAQGCLRKCIYIGDSEVDREFAENCCLPFYRLKFDRSELGLADQRTLHFEV